MQRELVGKEGSSWTLEEIRAFHRSPSALRTARAGWVDGQLVGAVEVRMPLMDNLALAMPWLSVETSHRRLGLGSAVLAEAEQIGADQRRTTFIVESEWAEGGSDLAESCATRRGYTVAQTMLRSSLDLKANRVEHNGFLEHVHDADAADDADAAADDADDAGDYAIESVVDHLPHEWLDDPAVLQQRMSTDAPTDDLALEEEAWDAERVRATHARTRESGRRIVESVARHRPSGRLVGFTRVSVSAGEPTLAYQQDTLVLREHRGQALGFRLKAANALLLQEALPQVTAVRTWNAASNELMLADNRRLGYVVDGSSHDWQKVVS